MLRTRFEPLSGGVGTFAWQGLQEQANLLGRLPALRRMGIRSLSRNLPPEFEQEIHNVASLGVGPCYGSVLGGEAGRRSAISLGLRVCSAAIPTIDPKAYEEPSTG
jgi:hypothetical protein